MHQGQFQKWAGGHGQCWMRIFLGTKPCSAGVDCSIDSINPLRQKGSCNSLKEGLGKISRGPSGGSFSASAHSDLFLLTCYLAFLADQHEDHRAGDQFAKNQRPRNKRVIGQAAFRTYSLWHPARRRIVHRLSALEKLNKPRVPMPGSLAAAHAFKTAKRTHSKNPFPTLTTSLDRRSDTMHCMSLRSLAIVIGTRKHPVSWLLRYRHCRSRR